MARNKSIKEDSYIREFLQLLKGRWYFVAGIIPFILGIIGYYVLASEDPELIQSLEMGDGIRFFIAAAYKSIRFYVLEYDNPEEICNNFLEIARWTAPIVTISGIAAILGNMVKHFKNRFLYRWWSFINVFKKIFKLGRPFVTIAFYGNDDYESKTLQRHLVKYDDTIIVKVIEMHKHIPRADLYILFSDDEDNFDFYQKHTKKLEKYCRLNSRKEKNRLLSREFVKEDFNGSIFKSRCDKNSPKNDNKYIIMKTEKYSIKDEISDYITLVNLQELGSFKFWAYRWKGIFYNEDCYRTELVKITSRLVETLYENRILKKEFDSSFIKDYVDYFTIGSIFLNYLINIDKDYVFPLCEALNKNLKDLKKSLRFLKLKKMFKVDNAYLQKFSTDVCNEVFRNVEDTKCITSDKFKNLKISIIGNNEMAEHLIFTALQLNIFNKNQQFTYNLFGDWDVYLAKHEKLMDNINSGAIVSYSSNFIDNKDVLEDSDVIIVCDDDCPNKIVDDLLLITCDKEIDIISTKQDMYLKYKSNEHVNFYNYLNKISNFGDFVEDNLNIDNIRKAYEHVNGKIDDPEKWKEFEGHWNSLPSTHRYNYICQEEFLEIMVEYTDDENLRNELNVIRKRRFCDFYNLQYDELPQ